jgi:hypothetical protein
MLRIGEMPSELSLHGFSVFDFRHYFDGQRRGRLPSAGLTKPGNPFC